MKKILLLVSLTLILGTAGCITVGQPFLKNWQTPVIVIGKTTQAEILKTYKEPISTGVEDGDVTWTYVDYHASLFNGWHSNYFFVRFAKDGTVESYNYSHGNSDTHGVSR
jgi:hypothetical protein